MPCEGWLASGAVGWRQRLPGAAPNIRGMHSSAHARGGAGQGSGRAPMIAMTRPTGPATAALRVSSAMWALES